MPTESVLFRGVKTPLDKIEVGASRIAGPPDLPIGVLWPVGPDRERLLPMVLQLRLADVPRTRLPRAGTLYFFGAQVAGYRGDEIDEIPAAIIYAPPGATLVRGAMPPEANDAYWDVTHVARCEGWRMHVSATEEDEPTDDDIHVLFPTRKCSSFGETPPAGFVPLLELRSDYAIAMNWGDAAWATWSLPDADLTAGNFERAIATVWIG
ncbi:MAG: YwqG family protein [Myxococcota bacterium]|nr:DUF1963 domain-containing protein [Deltaproteobacteria bacterium]MDQ3339815.1 YwqG family protein [Myxococcota bacterium]